MISNKDIFLSLIKLSVDPTIETPLPKVVLLKDSIVTEDNILESLLSFTCDGEEVIIKDTYDLSPPSFHNPDDIIDRVYARAIEVIFYHHIDKFLGE